MEKRVLTVLRTGGEYTDQHVLAIKRQLAKYAPDAHLVCLTDVDVAGVDCVPLHNRWPGWWSKIELFRPDLCGNYLYTDLDNVILGPIDFAFEPTFTADIGFSFFRMTPDVDRAAVLAEFCVDPEGHMDQWDPRKRNDGKFGDAAFFRHTCGLAPASWGTAVRNIADLQQYPWHEQLDPRRGRPELSVILCGGRRRRPWTHPAKAFRETYWCR